MKTDNNLLELTVVWIQIKINWILIKLIKINWQ